MPVFRFTVTVLLDVEAVLVVDATALEEVELVVSVFAASCSALMVANFWL